MGVRVAVAPDQLQQTAGREHLALVADQREQQPELLRSQQYLGPAAVNPPTEQVEQKAIAPTATPEPPLTEAAVATDVPPEPDETLFDKEAREARERLRDPERAERALAEGWTTPSDEAGTSERWG